MRWFSERHGHSNVRDSLQIDGIDNGSRGRIWNVITPLIPTDYYSALPKEDAKFIIQIWDRFYKLPVTNLRDYGNDWQIYNYILGNFLKGPWDKCYDLIEVIIAHHHDSKKVDYFIKRCNEVLVEEKCGYRIISKIVVPIIHENEINSIENAQSNPFENINQHLQSALELFSDRINPNYANSVKEAISAVESMSRIILADRNVTLGAALNRLDNSGVAIHGAFKLGISALYGWTSSDAGIRHARVDDSEIGFDEAKMMIVLCSAFVTYLKTKAEEVGIDLVANYDEIRDS